MGCEFDKFCILEKHLIQFPEKLIEPVLKNVCSKELELIIWTNFDF